MKILRQIFNKVIYRPPTTMPLGRWSTKDNSEIKNLLANYDNCGDIICKNTKELSKFLDKAHKEKK